MLDVQECQKNQTPRLKYITRGHTMDLTFREKSLWTLLAGLLAAFGFYVITVLPAAGPDVDSDQVVLFVVAVVLLIMVQIVGHGLIAALDQRTETDERDELIALRGARWGGQVLGLGVAVAMVAAVMSEGNFLFTHVLLAFWVLAELVEIGTQLAYYRSDS